MLSFLLYSPGHCTHLTKRLLLKAESPSRMFAPGCGEKAANVRQILEILLWTVIVIVTFLALWEIHSNIYAVGKNKMGANGTCDLYEAGSWARLRGYKNNLKTSAIKQIIEHALLLRKIRIGCKFGSTAYVISP